MKRLRSVRHGRNNQNNNNNNDTSNSNSNSSNNNNAASSSSTNNNSSSSIPRPSNSSSVSNSNKGPARKVAAAGVSPVNSDPATATTATAAAVQAHQPSSTSTGTGGPSSSGASATAAAAAAAPPGKQTAASFFYRLGGPATKQQQAPAAPTAAIANKRTSDNNNNNTSPSDRALARSRTTTTTHDHGLGDDSVVSLDFRPGGNLSHVSSDPAAPAAATYGLNFYTIVSTVNCTDSEYDFAAATNRNDAADEMAVDGGDDGQEEPPSSHTTPYCGEFKRAPTTYPPVWNEFRQAKMLCDAILESSDGKPFHIHRCILAANSPVFRTIFANHDSAARHQSQQQQQQPPPAAAPSQKSPRSKSRPSLLRKLGLGGSAPSTPALQRRPPPPPPPVTIMETSEDETETEEEEQQLPIIQMPSINSAEMEPILNFCYTGTFTFTASNVEPLLPLTRQFELHGMASQLANFLIGTICPENALTVYRLTQRFFCPKLQEQAKLFVLLNFSSIIKFPHFKSLSFQELDEFLRDDLLNMKSEELVFDVIQQWIEHEPTPARLGRLIELLQTIRFGLMRFNFFSNVIFNWKYVIESREVQHSLFDASIFLTELDSRSGSDIDLNDPLARPRIPFQIIFAVGGWSAGSPTSFMETYDTRADRWFLTTLSDISPRAYHGLVSVDNLIYMIGGFDGQDHFNTVRCFNPITKSWSEKSCMHHQRCYVSCCVLDRHIYAIGGFNGRSRMSSAERYNVDTNQWEELPPMARQRSDASACAFNGKVYVAGGFNGQEVLSSVEIYDPKIPVAEGQWTYIHPMHTPRSGVTLTAFKGCLYALGGFNGFNRLATAEKYDPNGDPADWVPITSMSSPRSNFAAVGLEDMLFAIGGFNGTTTIPYVEGYDPTSNEWFSTTPMNLNRSALAACVLNGLPNAKDYSYLSRVQELLGLSTNDDGGGGGGTTRTTATAAAASAAPAPAGASTSSSTMIISD